MRQVLTTYKAQTASFLSEYTSSLHGAGNTGFVTCQNAAVREHLLISNPVQESQDPSKASYFQRCAWCLRPQQCKQSLEYDGPNIPDITVTSPEGYERKILD
ncbi:hypothetical protein NUU61_001497 [Penicillium alfredii]|uniref:Uncharacterized protein n=1 Tax=Penicillium alfredii TaxID=1506179 RepID=A0A9W9G4J1_9EURO|nr:uncharacterized protein NUU61_001497 [Penicillium alfredii]KAJ5111867.1 hypothetical protein NUU61_001497 [Penicillium alfredii]